MFYKRDRWGGGEIVCYKGSDIRELRTAERAFEKKRSGLMVTIYNEASSSNAYNFSPPVPFIKIVIMIDPQNKNLIYPFKFNVQGLTFDFTIQASSRKDALKKLTDCLQDMVLDTTNKLTSIN